MMDYNDFIITITTPWRFLRCFMAIPFYFWAPCPLCGHYFGGWEWHKTLITGPEGGVGVCNRTACKNRAK